MHTFITKSGKRTNRTQRVQFQTHQLVNWNYNKVSTQVNTIIGHYYILHHDHHHNASHHWH